MSYLTGLQSMTQSLNIQGKVKPNAEAIKKQIESEIAQLEKNYQAQALTEEDYKVKRAILARKLHEASQT